VHKNRNLLPHNAVVVVVVVVVVIIIHFICNVPVSYSKCYNVTEYKITNNAKYIISKITIITHLYHVSSKLTNTHRQ